MQNHSYNIDLYSSALKSEVIKLYIVAIVLSILFIFVIVCSIIQIKKEKTKKIPYVQLFVAIIVFIFLLIPLSSQISSFTKDKVEQLLNKISIIKSVQQKLFNTTIEEMWLQELKILKK